MDPGAVARAEWTGVRLADALQTVGVRRGAVYTAHYSADTPLSGDEGKLPIAKAMTDNVLIAFAMNRGPLHKTQRRAAPLGGAGLAGRPFSEVAPSRRDPRPDA